MITNGQPADPRVQLAQLAARTATRADWVILLIAWRTAYGLTQIQAAAEIGVPYKTLEKWEQGYQLPKGKNLLKLSERLA